MNQKQKLQNQKFSTDMNQNFEIAKKKDMTKSQNNIIEKLHQLNFVFIIQKIYIIKTYIFKNFTVMYETAVINEDRIMGPHADLTNQIQQQRIQPVAPATCRDYLDFPENLIEHFAGRTTGDVQGVNVEQWQRGSNVLKMMHAANIECDKPITLMKRLVWV